MTKILYLCTLGCWYICGSLTLAADPPAVTAVVESTLATANGHIRQFAFDGDAKSYFLSEQHPKPEDSFTLTFEQPVTLKSIKVLTGSEQQPKQDDTLTAGVLEASTDGKIFTELAKFTAGEAQATAEGKKYLAIRIHPTEELKHSLAIREITLVSDPVVTIFKYPIEFTVVSTDAPELTEWANKAARACEKAYAMINEELQSPGFKPVTTVTMTMRKDYNGVAETAGNHIKGSVNFYKSNPDDIGSMVHETAHVVQAYRGRGNPGWLVEGVADYVRFFKYEPGKIGRIDARRANYNGSYRITASFLNFIVQKYDPDFVNKINQAMREGKYKDDLFQEYTKKSLDELNEEWKATLKK